MTKNPDFYPLLKNPGNLRRMMSVERTISRRSLFFIPKNDFRRLEDRICDGDLIAITTNREGLDVQHVGLGIRVKKRIHLLHTSSTEGKVVLSPQTLYRYLLQSRARSGIMVARVTLTKSEQSRKHRVTHLCQRPLCMQVSDLKPSIFQNPNSVQFYRWLSHQ